MTRAELNNFVAMLKAKHLELTRALGRRDGIAIERTPDALDALQFAAARELTTRSLERGTTLLRDVRGALARITEGAYGTCLHCEEEITKKRLQAMPWASLCLACQERADRDPNQKFAAEERLMDAA
jgi:DnaK suppressor protein